MKRYFTIVLTLSTQLTKRFMRDKTALFFTFLFPLLFLFVFGALSRGGDDLSFNVALINRSDTQFAQDFTKQAAADKTIEIDKEVTSIDEARTLMGRGQIDSIIELPQDFGKLDQQGMPSGKLVVYYEEATPQTGQTLASIMQSVLDGINKELTNHTDPFTVESKSTKTANLSSFDYTFSGLLGFTILSLGIFGMANGFPADKKTGILRRLRATPLGSSQLILATALEYMVMGLISVGLMIVVAIIFFDFQMTTDHLSFWLFTIFGIIVMFGFGLAIGGWAKNEIQAGPLSNIVAFPMMFLSGSFFPRFLMPEWLQNITTYLPLTPIVDGTRLILTEGQTLLNLGPQLAVMAVWTLIIYTVAIRVFKWE